MMISFFSTHFFQTGLLLTLTKKFQITIWTWLVYLTISVIYHVFSLVCSLKQFLLADCIYYQYRKANAFGVPLSASLVAAYTIQRLCKCRHILSSLQKNCFANNGPQISELLLLERDCAKNMS
ncbi:hypothetical protein TTRE_0000394801 [Trichuris trichiura]|uniref:Uncharacterized protein n=1 Tax=Trichuris trichiura TaxID=36087 RepID=A0A077ZAH8_TRITR|nr:hypothetical protein TTRE_0000394801 [Trichuris trichiura]